MQRQRHCYNPPQALGRLTPSVSKGTNQQKKRWTSGKISLLTLSLLMYPVESSHPLPINHLPSIQKKTKTSKKVLGTDEGREKAKTFWQQMLMSFLRRKKETPPKLNTSTTRRRAITPTSIFRRGNKS